jgi:hypothetical protein
MEQPGEQARSNFHLDPLHGNNCIVVVISHFLVLGSQLYVELVFVALVL